MTRKWGSSTEETAGIAPKPWQGWRLGVEDDAGPRPPEVDVLAALTAMITTPSKAQQQLRNLVDRALQAAYAASLDQLPQMVGPPETCNQLGGQEGRALTKVRPRSPSGLWEPPLTFVRSQPTPCESFPRRNSWARVDY